MAMETFSIPVFLTLIPDLKRFVEGCDGFGVVPAQLAVIAANEGLGPHGKLVLVLMP